SRGSRSSRGSSSGSSGSSRTSSRRPVMLEALFWPALLGYGEAAVAYASPRTTRAATWGVRIGWLAQTALLAVQAARADGFPLATLERLTWRTAAVSLPLLTLGLVAGIVRSRRDHAGFDALEAVTLLTWLVYGGFVALRPRGPRAAYLALGGFALVIVARLALA